MAPRNFLKSQTSAKGRVVSIRNKQSARMAIRRNGIARLLRSL